MKINIVNYEQALGLDGILSKYAHSMDYALTELGHEVSVMATPTPAADVNHHINYQSYVHQPGTINTLQITHITDDDRIQCVKRGMTTADYGVCFSHQTEDKLSALGIENITTILPAHDSLDRRPLIISLLTNVYPNGCKRERMFLALLKTIDVKKFVFIIMGSGWGPVLEPLLKSSVQLQLFPVFEPKAYAKILMLSDYCLYLGEDEGSMGILDAAHARVQTIAPNTGFHREIGITHPFGSQKKLNAIFQQLEHTSVDTWTWENYCKQHIKLWEALRKKSP